MSGARPSLLALILDRPVEDVAEVVAAARAAGGIDRASAHRADGTLAQDVHWGGRMQRAVVRAIDEAGTPLLRTEVAIASDGLAEGLSRQVALLAALAQALPGRVRRVRDLSARVDRDEAWMTRVSAGVVEVGDAVVSIIGAQAPPAGWVLTHGAARFGVPDLELYGVPAGAAEAAVVVLDRVAGQLVAGGARCTTVAPRRHGAAARPGARGVAWPARRLAGSRARRGGPRSRTRWSAGHAVGPSPSAARTASARPRGGQGPPRLAVN